MVSWNENKTTQGLYIHLQEQYVKNITSILGKVFQHPFKHKDYPLAIYKFYTK